MDSYKFDHQLAFEKISDVDSFLIEAPLKTKRKSPLVIAGVDEAGRGPLAGPVVAAAVILPFFPKLSGLADSKVLSEEEREELFPKIKRTALAFSIVSIEAEEIDQTNILQATMKAMRLSLEQLKIQPSLAIIDGNQKPLSPFREIALVKGDSKSAAVMAASVLAKVTRDRIMMEWHKEFPQYQFDVHKGYGVPVHVEHIKKYGPCRCHRKSFEPIKSLTKEPLELLF